MTSTTFERVARVEGCAREVFDWHLRQGALERMTPPWEPVEVVERDGGIADGGCVVLSVPAGPFRMRWVARHVEFEDGRLFRDEMQDGPFALWDHTHRVHPSWPGACRLVDRIEYALPFGVLGRLLGSGFVRRKLERVFAFRHRTLQSDFAARAAQPGRETMKIAVTGAGGLVGSELLPLLTTAGDEVVRLVRSKPAPAGSAHWNPLTGEVDAAALDGVEGVVHLAGEGIADGRWSDAKKARIRDSRVVGTRRLCEALARLETPPKVLVCASAIGFYGDRGDAELTEDSPAGEGFLADVCRAWEDACAPAREAGIRVVNLRIGVVLSPRGGALAKMLLPFKMGAGGVLGNGRQHMSWISIDDLAGAIDHALRTDALSGPVNGVAPLPVTNREFTKTLGRVLRRPTIFPVPAFGARLAFGEMADALLLSSQRVLPRRLQAAGYTFRHADLESALRHVLGRE